MTIDAVSINGEDTKKCSTSITYTITDPEDTAIHPIANDIPLPTNALFP